MEKIESTFKVTVWDVQIDRSYFSFEFSVDEDGKEIERDFYSGTHVWADDRSAFMEYLQNGAAVRLALEAIT